MTHWRSPWAHDRGTRHQTSRCEEHTDFLGQIWDDGVELVPEACP